MAAQKPIFLNNGVLTRFQSGDYLAIEDGGTGAITPSGARTALGLTIGSDVQGWDAQLDALAAMNGIGYIVQTAVGTYAARTLSGTAGRITISNPAGTAADSVIDLATLADGGGGAFLKFTRDAYGRVSGTSAVGAGDLTTLLDTTYVSIAGDTMTGPLTLPGAPSNALHAATKQYVDDVMASGGVAPFAAVRTRSSTNITLSAPQTVSGVAVIAGDRVLVAGQTTASQNGIYTVAAGAWVRATDADVSTEFVPGRNTFVAEGTFANTGWAYSGAATPTIGSTAITFTQTSGAAAYTAGAGLLLTGNDFSVGTASSARIVINADTIDLATVTDSGTGTFLKIARDTYGRVTGTTAVLAADISGLLDADLTAIAALATNGVLVRTGTSTWATRTITGTAGRIGVTNGDGVSGAPTVDLVATAITPGTYNGITFDAYGRATGAVAVSSESVTTTLTNGEASAIAIGRAVYVSASGQVRLANANSATTTEVVGIMASVSTAAGASGSVCIAGLEEATTAQWDAVTGQTGGLTFGAKYYLSNTTAGSLTTTAPGAGHVVLVGRALSTTKLALNIGPVIAL